MKCKVINSDRDSLEENVNYFLNSNNIEIYNMLQTECTSNGYITLTIFYDDIKDVKKSKNKNL